MLLGIGSIIRRARPNCVVWGSGIKTFHDSMESRGATVLAVRGYITQEWLLKNGAIDRSQAISFGDPALLAPIYWPAPGVRKWEVGVVPHFMELEAIRKSQLPSQWRLIEVTQDPVSVIDEIACCSLIVSSSLHGLIVANAYRIPSVWVKWSNAICQNGGEAKYLDYIESIGAGISVPLDLQNNDLSDERVQRRLVEDQALRIVAGTNLVEMQRGLLASFPGKITRISSEMLRS
ncbi:MAG: polysaccharide pyruvyl transferase family protein [Verrucomicrobiae bacterium]|nr:polysaccharide pyruvyl transferase family protein [Verrucomicrobiae bacterium]